MHITVSKVVILRLLNSVHKVTKHRKEEYPPHEEITSYIHSKF